MIFFSISPEGPAPAPPAETDQADQGTVDDTSREGQEKDASQPLPEFGQYLYFLFVPTLVYRDQYPM